MRVVINFEDRFINIGGVGLRFDALEALKMMRPVEKRTLKTVGKRKVIEKTAHEEECTVQAIQHEGGKTFAVSRCGKRWFPKDFDVQPYIDMHRAALEAWEAEQQRLEEEAALEPSEKEIFIQLMMDKGLIADASDYEQAKANAREAKRREVQNERG